MSTVAWDGKTLAADRQATIGTSKCRVRKLFDCGDYVYAATGDWGIVNQLAEWLREGAEMGRAPVLDESGHWGIVVQRRGAIPFTLEGKRPALGRLRSAFASAGSGHEYARAAMALGKTAVQAVALASRFDIYTGLGVDSVRLGARP